MVNIKNFLKYTKDDSLIRDSFILFVATMIMNLGAFLYHFVMGRMLGPEGYGILGVVLGFVVNKIIEYIAVVQFSVSYLQTSSPAWLIVGALAFGFGIGSLSGLLPALQAARLKPTDALRYE